MEDLDSLVSNLPRPIDCEPTYCINKVNDNVNTLKPLIDSIENYLQCSNSDPGNKITILSTFVSLRKCIECYSKYHETMNFAKAYQNIFNDLVKKTSKCIDIPEDKIIKLTDFYDKPEEILITITDLIASYLSSDEILFD